MLAILSVYQQQLEINSDVSESLLFLKDVSAAHNDAIANILKFLKENFDWKMSFLVWLFE